MRSGFERTHRQPKLLRDSSSSFVLARALAKSPFISFVTAITRVTDIPIGHLTKRKETALFPHLSGVCSLIAAMHRLIGTQP